ncbi:hypothetical protein I215_04890 [Galbibacter marinus]|uniref:Tetratricopeptide repeat protein n=1 Tax=Galbibacter marinus TaxID=555500 RepID=K2PTI4_9FLAO|nr:hypothetical protein [Galbibacter marinus]EKF55860.1 hypothetical protein I215_04890 [Galbibacter marinus]
MNISDFSNLLSKPENLSQENIEALEKVIDAFPYFQSARAVYLKALKQQGSYKYNGELKQTAAYTTDRSILFEFITSEEFKQHGVAKKIASHIANEQLYPIEVIAEEVIVRDHKTAFDFNQVDAEAVMDPELFQPKTPAEKKKQIKPIGKPDEVKSPSETLEIGKPLDFNTSESHSFVEWLQLSSTPKPINREKVEKPTSDKKNHLSAIEQKLKLIDRFIENNPKIPPAGNTTQNKGNLAKAVVLEKNELMTETLARVYLEQKKYKKAIQAYKILSLKYPEKSGFFADQIKAVTKLKDNN